MNQITYKEPLVHSCFLYLFFKLIIPITRSTTCMAIKRCYNIVYLDWQPCSTSLPITHCVPKTHNNRMCIFPNSHNTKHYLTTSKGDKSILYTKSAITIRHAHSQTHTNTVHCINNWRCQEQSKHFKDSNKQAS